MTQKHRTHISACLASALLLLGLTICITSCSDLLESESSRQVFSPDINSKTDSVFYGFGIMQCMQQLADTYVFQGEMHGDNVAMTASAGKQLRRLATFDTTSVGAYDSAYVYYQVINNCNYFIAHRDTTLYTGSDNVTLNEYAAIKAFRAWAYLQLARTYGRVPYVTTPVTTIGQMDTNLYPWLDLDALAEKLTADLLPFSGYAVPTYGNVTVNAGTTNWNSNKTIVPRRCFIPVDVILGDLYLETGDYAAAAHHYTTFLTTVDTQGPKNLLAAFDQDFALSDNLPNDMDNSSMKGTEWSNIFKTNSTIDIITYIPMAAGGGEGVTTAVPKAFGMDYYATSSRELYTSGAAVVPSESYRQLAQSGAYYYYQSTTNPLLRLHNVGEAALGDMRYPATVLTNTIDNVTTEHVTKYDSGNIILYRYTTVWLHLAEALNRMGHPDAAFAILKDGVSDLLLDSTSYLTAESRQLLTITYPFLGQYKSLFQKGTADLGDITGIHSHGAGVTWDYLYPGRSPYQYEAMVGQQMAKTAIEHGVAVTGCKQDSIDAVENLICDEYQLELAFEGSRWYDLMRLARHKNASSPYGANYGSRWLAAKLAYKHPAVDLTDATNWYVPFK